MVRQKFRYFLLELIPESPRAVQKLQDGEIYKAIATALRQLHGDEGLAAQQSNMRVKYLNPETGIVFLRSRRGPHEMVKDAMGHINRIGNCITKVAIIHISGTMRSSQKFLVRHHRRELLKMLAVCRTEQQRDAIRKAMNGLLDNVTGKPVESERMEVD